MAFFWYLLVGSTECGGNEQGFKEGISKLVYRAGEGIFFGNGFHRVLFYLRFRRGFHCACLTLLNDFPGALSFCDVCFSPCAVLRQSVSCCTVSLPFCVTSD